MIQFQLLKAFDSSRKNHYIINHYTTIKEHKKLNYITSPTHIFILLCHIFLTAL